MRRTATAIATLLLLTGAAGCSSDKGTDSAKASPSTSPSPTAREYDVHDCKALLERNYEAEQNRDASSDPECEHLTEDEYTEVVKDVLTGRKGEILDDAANHVAWDEAWDQTDTEQQTLVCGRLKEDGATVVGQEMMAESDEPSGDEIEMAQYYLDEKC